MEGGNRKKDGKRLKQMCVKRLQSNFKLLGNTTTKNIDKIMHIFFVFQRFLLRIAFLF